MKNIQPHLSYHMGFPMSKSDNAPNSRHSAETEVVLEIKLIDRASRSFNIIFTGQLTTV